MGVFEKTPDTLPKVPGTQKVHRESEILKAPVDIKLLQNVAPDI
jgi:hypothetical protein